MAIPVCKCVLAAGVLGSFALSGLAQRFDSSVLRVDVYDAYGTQLDNVRLEVTQLGGNATADTDFATNGTYEVRHPARTSASSSNCYRVRVFDSAGRVLYETMVNSDPLGLPVRITLPPDDRERPVSGVVSVGELQHKVDKAARKEFERARKAHARKKNDEALAHLQRAVDLDPEFLLAQWVLGAEMMRRQKYEQAIAAFQAVTRISPKQVEAYNNLGAAYLLLNRKAEAEAAARRAVVADSGSRRAHYLLGISLASQAKITDETFRSLEAGASQFPSAHVIAAQLLLEQGKVPEARTEAAHYMKSGDKEHRAAVEKWLAGTSDEGVTSALAKAAAASQGDEE